MSKIEVNTIEPQCGTTLTVGASGDTITFPTGTTIVNNGTQTGFGRTGTVDWNTTPKTATFTAVSGDGFFANTTGSAFNMNLPAGVAGAIVSVADYAGTWQTNNLTVVPNGTDKIGGQNVNVALSTEGQSVTFIFVDSTQGWINTMDSTSNVRGNPFLVATGGTITTSGNCKIHTFTGPGTFTVTNASATADENIVSYMLVAGGGGGGGRNSGGGGGAGGFREIKSPITPYTASPLDGYPSAPNRVTITAQAYPITVGGGGAGGSNSPSSPLFTTPAGNGANGSNSIFSTITSAGGGGGNDSSNPSAAPESQGQPGGSGGGGAGECAHTGGTGNTPPVTPSQGTNGGTGGPGSNRRGGGGGGATVAGYNGEGDSPPMGGGAGATTSISTTPTAYAGGGGGASEAQSCAQGPGGTGGGATGLSPGSPPSNNAPSAPANTGGGGGARGGGGPVTGGGGSGGSGIVIIRYKFQ